MSFLKCLGYVQYLELCADARRFISYFVTFSPEPDDSSSDEDETPVRATRSGKAKASTAGLSDAMSGMSIAKSKPKTQSTPPTSPPKAAKGKAKAPAEALADKEHPALVSEVGDLYLWDFSAEQFNVIEEEVAAKVVDAGGEPFNCKSASECL